MRQRKEAKERRAKLGPPTRRCGWCGEKADRLKLTKKGNLCDDCIDRYVTPSERKLDNPHGKATEAVELLMPKYLL